MDLSIHELEWGQRSSMVKEGKFIINSETGEEIDIKQEDFKFVQQDSKIHDVKFGTKATTFFRDSMRRFVKSKSALVGAIIVGLLAVLSIIVPELTPDVGAYDVERANIGGQTVEKAVIKIKLDK